MTNSSIPAGADAEGQVLGHGDGEGATNTTALQDNTFAWRTEGGRLVGETWLAHEWLADEMVFRWMGALAEPGSPQDAAMFVLGDRKLKIPIHALYNPPFSVLFERDEAHVPRTPEIGLSIGAAEAANLIAGFRAVERTPPDSRVQSLAGGSFKPTVPASGFGSLRLARFT